ncbi:type VII secretion protein EccB [Mycobacterium sp. 1245805.9]|uniref:type VII secretion protein EccB n=1 Tax=Mycobacterium sp. 1245805.9 TaxID=1856862 RepID=UPI0026F46792|nr:type VII secretion protein EccB [Mycobacterium sp. 1245805.9]
MRQPTTWLQISAHRFLLRRLECALLGRDIHTPKGPVPDADGVARGRVPAGGHRAAGLGVAGCAAAARGPRWGPGS